MCSKLKVNYNINSGFFFLTHNYITIGIKRKFNLISNNGSTIATQDAILLVRSIGENPTNKEFKHELEESKLHNKERLDLKGN
jgi:hypothetical protein